MARNEQINVGDKCEDVCQKIASMKDEYAPILMGMYKKLTNSMQNSSTQTQNPAQIHKYQKFKVWLENAFKVLNRSPATITPDVTMEKLVSIEKTIIDVVKYQKTRNIAISQQQGKQQLQPSDAQSLQSQIPMLQGTEIQLNLLQATNLKTSVRTTQSNSVVRLQNDLLPSQYKQSNFVSTLQPSSGLEGINRNPMSLLQQGSVGSVDKIHINAAQWGQSDVLSKKDMNRLQPKTNSPQQNCSAVHPQFVKQQFHHCQSPHQLIQQQRVEQKIQQQKLQQSARTLSPQITQTYQMNKVSVTQEKQSVRVKPEIFLEDQTVSHTTQHPQTDQQRMTSVSLSKSGTDLQAASYSKSSLSPPISLVPSSVLSDREKQTCSISSHSNAESGMHMPTQPQALVIHTPGIPAPTLSSETASPDNTQHITSTLISPQTCETERPLDRLGRVVKSMSHIALRVAVNDMYSIVSMVDGMSGSHPGNNSKAPLAEDLVDANKQYILADNILPEGNIATTNKLKSHSSGMPLTVVSRNLSENLSFKLSNGMEASELASMASSRNSRVEVNHALLKEIREINRQLICTRLDIIVDDSNSVVPETSKGTVLKCSFTAITSKQDQTLPVLSMHMIVSSKYPNCSPTLLNELPLESCSKEKGDLLVKAKSEFSRYLRCVSHPVSLTEMARSWTTCAHAVILEYCEQRGGGSFTSRYGTWKIVSQG